MNKYKVTYSEGDTINKTATIEAGSRSKAMIEFWVQFPEATDISKVERVTEEDD